MSCCPTLCRLALTVTVLAGTMAPCRAGFTITIDGATHQGDNDDKAFVERDGKLFLRTKEFVVVGTDQKVKIAPIDLTKPVVEDSSFTVAINGKEIAVTGLRLTNLAIQAQEDVDGLSLAASIVKNYAEKLKVGGVLLRNNYVQHAVKKTTHLTQLTNKGYIDDLLLGTVTQSDNHSEAGKPWELKDNPARDGKEIEVAAGDHTIKTVLTLKLDKGSVLGLTESGHAGVAAVPGPSTFLLAVSSLGLLGGRWWNRKRPAPPE